MNVRILPVVVLFSFSVPAISQSSSVDTVVQALFLSLKHKDEKAYMNIFPSYTLTKNMFRKSVDKMKGKMDIPDTNFNMDSLLDVEFGKFTEEAYKTEIQGNLKKSFQSVLKQGEERGLNWSRSQLSGYNLDTLTEPGTGTKAVKGTLALADSAQEYELFFTDMLFFDEEGKWYGASLNNITRKGEHAENADADGLPPVDEPAPQKPAPAKTKKPAGKPKA